MNYKIVINIVGFLLILTGGFIVTGIPFSIYYNSDDILSLLICGAGTSLIGLLTWYLTRSVDRSDIGKREGYLVVSLGWIFMSLFGALPFVVHGSIPNYTDAFFETMSGFTTTGASILKDIESVPAGLLFWRSLTQWLGGMGIIVLSLAILPLLGIGGMQLFSAEVPGITKDKFHPRVKETAKRLWGIYVILTAAEILLLLVGGLSLFDAINHAFTTMATGGFSTKNASTAYYTSPYVQYVFIVFMIFAGMNFTLHYYALHFRFESFKRNTEFKFYILFLLVATILIMLIHRPHHTFDLEESFRQTLFHVVSLVTTTGYVSSDYENWAPFSRMIFFILLFVGGCAGSTGGGIKFARHYLLLRNGLLELKRLIHPRAVIPVRFNGKAVNQEIISNVQAFFILYILLFVLGSVLLSLLGLDFLTAAGAVATCIGNVGPGMGVVGPVSNFADLPGLSKWILSFFMLVGRLELFTVLILLSTSFWKK
ncbi:MAG: TrkH family potassium uptake protein [Ignavibacteriales bacterium]|nr:MAG: TrkH family potassium uptake protein [Ignavibacteriales bacterium]